MNTLKWPARKLVALVPVLLAVSGAPCFARGASGVPEAPPVRLAIVSEEPQAAPAADLLTVQLSHQDGVLLLERAQIAKVLSEQALAAAGARDYLKLGEILGADGLLVLELKDKEDRQVLSARLLAVKPGVELDVADYDFPLAEPGEWSKLLAGEFAPLFSKLGVLRKDAVPISILNLRSAVAGTDAQILERQLTLLLHDRLMKERDFFVLERRRLELLADEKALKDVSESPFWNGSYLLEGAINPRSLDSNSVTLSIQLTPPDPTNILSVEVAGARTNLPALINDLTLRITRAIHKGSATSNWVPAAEAERYFEEAKWMLKWGMFQEAKTASEAAWALGRQTRETAELRIKAYQGCAGDPGDCMLHDLHISFARRIKQRIGEWGPSTAFASVPDPRAFADGIHGAQLWLEGFHDFVAPGKFPDSSWLGLGATNLDRCSRWLRYFYFNIEARAGEEDAIPQARQVCRETAQILARHADSGIAVRTPAWLDLVAKHSAFWAETPEDTLRGYQELLAAGQWPAVRRRFFNDLYKEVTLLRIKQGYSWMESDTPSSGSDASSPCLAGWDWEARKRCPQLWDGFIDQLCASPKPLVALEGRILRCSYSWSGADYKDNLTRLLDYIREQYGTIAAAGLDKKLVDDLQPLVDNRVPTLVDPDKAQAGELWQKFKSDLDELAGKQSTTQERQTRVVEMEKKAKYLESETNFNFASFVNTLLNDNYSVEEATRLLPLVTNYHVRLTGGAPTNASPHDPKAFMAQAALAQPNMWIGNLETKLKNIISPQPPATTPPAAVASTAAQPPAHPPGPGRPPVFPPGVAPPVFPSPFAPRSQTSNSADGIFPASAQQGPPGAVFSSAPITSVRFWNIPTTDDQSNPSKPIPHIISCCYRDEKLWVEVLYDRFGKNDIADFFAVDLKSFTSRRVGFQGDGMSFLNLGKDKERGFDIDNHYLYLWVKDSVRRYSLEQQTWERFALAGAARPVRLGNRLFFTGPTSILEYHSDGSMQVLASTRRRPAATALDNLDNYSPAHLFLGTKGQVNLCANNELYVLSGTNDWQRSGTFPNVNWSAADFGEDGFLARTPEDWWGMCSVSSKPELLFRQTMPHATFRHADADPDGQQSVPKWQEPPPSATACLDRDCFWFVPDLSRRPFDPMLPPTQSSAAPMFTIVGFKYGESRSVTIPVQISDPTSRPTQRMLPGMGGPNDRASSPMNRWSLTATPEGLIANRNLAPGFWLIPRADLNHAMAEAFSHDKAAKPLLDAKGESANQDSVVAPHNSR